jgi:prepilin-type N-terminal cleavage/methylation domain-containing protein
VSARPTTRGSRARGGFSLIEILVAMGLLVVGMSGILALFSASLALQKQAAERLDVGLSLSAIQAEVEQDLARRLAADSKVSPLKLSGAEFPVPGDRVYKYRVTLQALPGDASGRGYLCRVVVVARERGQENLYDLGYIPVVPRPDNDALIRSTQEEPAPARAPSR